MNIRAALVISTLPLFFGLAGLLTIVLFLRVNAMFYKGKRSISPALWRLSLCMMFISLTSFPIRWCAFMLLSSSERLRNLFDSNVESWLVLISFGVSLAIFDLIWERLLKQLFVPSAARRT